MPADQPPELPLGLLSHSPEGFSRYYVLVNILKALIRNQRAAVLDVGGNSIWMREFIRAYGLHVSLTIVDPNEPFFDTVGVHYIQEDFLAWSSETTTEQWDVVMSTDVLEHIPKFSRPVFIDRCIELARTAVILAAPFESPLVVQAEQTINDIYRELTGAPHPWLQEHLNEGAPNIEDVLHQLRTRPVEFTHVETNALENWLLTFALNISGELGDDKGEVARLNAAYNRKLSAMGDLRPPGYRTFIVAYKDDARKRDVDAALEALAGTVEEDERLRYIGDLATVMVAQYVSACRARRVAIDESDQLRKHLTSIISSPWYRLYAALDKLGRVSVVKMRHAADRAVHGRPQNTS